MSDLTKQDLVDMVFIQKAGFIGLDYDKNDAKLIKKILSQEGIDISIAECIEFWRWRSDRYDANWLIVRSDKDVVQWFDEFLKFNSKFLLGEEDEEGDEENEAS